MLEGLWTVQYDSRQAGGDGAGIAVLVNGRILGGDYGYTWEGHYAIKGDWFAASVHVSNYLPHVPNALGTYEDLNVEFAAPLNPKEIRATLTIVGQPGPTIDVKMIKKADLETAASGMLP